MSRATKQFKREDDDGFKGRAVSGKEQRSLLILEAIRFLSGQKTTKNFCSIAEVRRRFKLDGRTRVELMEQLSKIIV